MFAFICYLSFGAVESGAYTFIRSSYCTTNESRRCINIRNVLKLSSGGGSKAGKSGAGKLFVLVGPPGPRWVVAPEHGRRYRRNGGLAGLEICREALIHAEV